MVEERYNAVYAQRVEMSKKLNSINPIASLVHEFAEHVIEEKSKAIFYIRKIQSDLYLKGVIPFEVNCVEDLQKIDTLPFGDTRSFLWYVYHAYRRMEEGWEWDEKEHMYLKKGFRDRQEII